MAEATEAIAAAVQHGLAVAGYEEARASQVEVVEAYCKGHDCIMVAPTGSGKSLTFEIAPFVLDELHGTERSVVLVVSPLVALMKSQTAELNARGIASSYYDVTDPTSVDYDARILMASPEAFLQSEGLWDKITDMSSRIKAIFVDEAHCVVKWGSSSRKKKTKSGKSKKKEAFRKDYGRLADLRAHVGEVPIVALTATANDEERKQIEKILGLVNPVCCVIPPEKKNLVYYVVKGSSHNAKIADNNFRWVVDILQREQENAPRMLIFFRRMALLTPVYEMLLADVGDPSLFNMYHQSVEGGVKEKILVDFSKDSRLRVALCSTSFSMGLNLKGVLHTIHFGPADDLSAYLQETGRACRQPGESGVAVILTYPHGTGACAQDMRDVLKTKTCRRQTILAPYYQDSEPESLTPGHACCDLCLAQCDCPDCPGVDPLVKQIQNSIDEPFREEEHSDSGSVSGSGSETGSESSGSDIECTGSRASRPLLNLYSDDTPVTDTDSSDCYWD